VCVCVCVCVCVAGVFKLSVQLCCCCCCCCMATYYKHQDAAWCCLVHQQPEKSRWPKFVTAQAIFAHSRCWLLYPSTQFPIQGSETNCGITHNNFKLPRRIPNIPQNIARNLSISWQYWNNLRALPISCFRFLHQ